MILDQIFELFTTSAALVILNGFVKDFLVKDFAYFRTFMSVACVQLEPFFEDLYDQWSLHPDLHELERKIVSTTFEEICRYRDEDFTAVFACVERMIELNFHSFLRKKLGDGQDIVETFELDVDKHIFKVNSL